MPEERSQSVGVSVKGILSWHSSGIILRIIISFSLSNLTFLFFSVFLCLYSVFFASSVLLVPIVAPPGFILSLFFVFNFFSNFYFDLLFFACSFFVFNIFSFFCSFIYIYCFSIFWSFIFLVFFSFSLFYLFSFFFIRFFAFYLISVFFAFLFFCYLFINFCFLIFLVLVVLFVSFFDPLFSFLFYLLCFVVGWAGWCVCVRNFCNECCSLFVHRVPCRHSHNQAAIKHVIQWASQTAADIWSLLIGYSCYFDRRIAISVASRIKHNHHL